MDENAERPLFNQQPPENRKKNGVPKIIPPFVWLVAIFITGLVVGNLLWLATADVLALGREDQAVEITVSEADSLSDISAALKEAGLIHYPWLFRLYGKLTHAEEKIKPGTYALNARYDYHALVTALSTG